VTPEEIALQLEVERLYTRYAAAIDELRLDDWCALFCEDCFYAIVPRDNFDRGLPLAIMRCESRAMLADRARAIRETMMYEPRYVRHQITNVCVTNGVPQRGQTPLRNAPLQNAIAARANYAVFEVLPDELPKVLSVGRSIDTIVREADGVLRFREKRVVYDSVLVPNSIIYPL
jgi:3-phenylpropionate/cinnamic acid dioxygenase small subunit